MPISPFGNPASPQAAATAQLFRFVLALGAAVFAIVAGIIIVAAIRFRHRPGQGDPAPDTGRPGIEVVWVGAAALLLLVIFVPTVSTMARLVNLPNSITLNGKPSSLRMKAKPRSALNNLAVPAAICFLRGFPRLGRQPP